MHGKGFTKISLKKKAIIKFIVRENRDLFVDSKNNSSIKRNQNKNTS